MTKALLLFAKLHVAAVVFFRRASQEGQWISQTTGQCKMTHGVHLYPLVCTESAHHALSIDYHN